MTDFASPTSCMCVYCVIIHCRKRCLLFKAVQLFKQHILPVMFAPNFWMVFAAGVRTAAAGLELLLRETVTNSGSNLSNTTSNGTTFGNITYSTNSSTYNSSSNTFSSNRNNTVLNYNSSSRGELFVISDALLSRDEAQAFCKNYTVRNANYSKFGNFTFTG